MVNLHVIVVECVPLFFVLIIVEHCGNSDSVVYANASSVVAKRYILVTKVKQTRTMATQGSIGK